MSLLVRVDAQQLPYFKQQVDELLRSVAVVRDDAADEIKRIRRSKASTQVYAELQSANIA